MTPLEMIAEWRKGCTVAGPMHSHCFPDGDPLPAGYCVECTEGLIDALESRLRRGEPSEVERAREYVASSMHDRDRSWGDLVRAGERDDCPEMRMVLKAMRTERQIEDRP